MYILFRETISALLSSLLAALGSELQTSQALLRPHLFKSLVATKCSIFPFWAHSSENFDKMSRIANCVCFSTGLFCQLLLENFAVAGVSPKAFLGFGYTPFCSRNYTFSKAPALVATWSGVSPALFSDVSE